MMGLFVFAFVYLYISICAFVYLCICVFVYVCLCKQEGGLHGNNRMMGPSGSRGLLGDQERKEFQWLYSKVNTSISLNWEAASYQFCGKGKNQLVLFLFSGMDAVRRRSIGTHDTVLIFKISVKTRCFFIGLSFEILTFL